MRRPTRHSVLLASGAALSVALLSVLSAEASAASQANKVFLGVSGGLFQPLNDRHRAAYDPSFGLQLEGGFILASPIGPSLAIAPTVTGKLLFLRDRESALVDATWGSQLLGGVKVGLTAAGAFAYGQIDVGISRLRHFACRVETFGCANELDDRDTLLRVGAGLDYSLGGLAVGVWGGLPMFLDDRIGQQPAAVELLGSLKILIP